MCEGETGCSRIQPPNRVNFADNESNGDPGVQVRAIRASELPDAVPGFDPLAVDSGHKQPIFQFVFDNPALLRVNPQYLAWLLSLPTLERERLLGGRFVTPGETLEGVVLRPAG